MSRNNIMGTWTFLWKKKLSPYRRTDPGTMLSLLLLMRHLQSLAGFTPYPAEKRSSKRNISRNKMMLA
jgi:hypothetical protein